MEENNFSFLKTSKNAQIVWDSKYFDSPKQTLIFLHGLGGNLSSWDKERKYLHQKGFSSIAFDLRGHGFSSRSSIPNYYKLTNFVEDLYCVINTLNISKPIIIGHCFGGMVTILFEHLHPNISSKIVLVDTSFKAPDFSAPLIHQKLARKILNLIAKYGPKSHQKQHENFDKFIGTTDLDPKRVISDITHTSIRSYISIINNVLDYNSESILEGINKPTLILEGSKDTIYPPLISKIIHHKIAKSILRIIPKANHIIVINNPIRTASEIEAFLKNRP